TPVIDGIGLLQQALESWVHDQLRTAGSPPTDLYDRFLKVAEPVLLRSTLMSTHGNRLATGRLLGLARATVRKLLRQYDLDGSRDADLTADDDVVDDPPA
ncbi:MAG: hypothetical protein ACRCZF_20485, partial [Gemmataceae bacterium]